MLWLAVRCGRIPVSFPRLSLSVLMHKRVVKQTHRSNCFAMRRRCLVEMSPLSFGPLKIRLVEVILRAH
ncbi:hypothetical protein DTL00_19715 [Sphingomonas melonis]